MVCKNNAPFINCVTKINGIKIDNAEDSDVLMPMYNLFEYSKNYKKTTGSLWNYYRDEPNSSTDNNNITHSILNSESFDYNANFMENGVAHNNLTIFQFSNYPIQPKNNNLNYLIDLTFKNVNRLFVLSKTK